MRKSPFFCPSSKTWLLIRDLRYNHIASSCYPVPHRLGDGVLFSIDFFLCIFLSFFLSLLARLRENGWTDLHEIFREGVEWPWDDPITFLVNSENPCDTAMRNTGTGFVVLSHYSLLSLENEQRLATTAYDGRYEMRCLEGRSYQIFIRSTQLPLTNNWIIIITISSRFQDIRPQHTNEQTNQRTNKHARQIAISRR